MINQLLREHDNLRLLADELEGLVKLPAMPSYAKLADCRWRFTRDILQHLSHDERQVFSPLLSEQSSNDTARKLKEELLDLYDAFQFHVDRWNSHAISRDWPGYGLDVIALLSALRKRMHREEALLYPLVASAKPASALLSRN